MKPSGVAEEMKCPSCKETVNPVVEDYSFDHEFGTEHQYAWVCPECGEQFSEKDITEIDFNTWEKEPGDENFTHRYGD